MLSKGKGIDRVRMRVLFAGRFRRVARRWSASRPTTDRLRFTAGFISLLRLISPPQQHSRQKKKKKNFPEGSLHLHLPRSIRAQHAKMETTRVFVSGLPPSCSNDQLRNHFASRYQVTDAHVLPKRRMGFVGFKSNEVAKQAVKYFNRTYMKMSKITVDLARPVCATLRCRFRILSFCRRAR